MRIFSGFFFAARWSGRRAIKAQSMASQIQTKLRLPGSPADVKAQKRAGAFFFEESIYRFQRPALPSGYHLRDGCLQFGRAAESYAFRIQVVTSSQSQIGAGNPERQLAETDYGIVELEYPSHLR